MINSSQYKEVFFVFNCNNNNYISDSGITRDLHKVKYMSETKAVDIAYELGNEWGVGSCLIETN